MAPSLLTGAEKEELGILVFDVIPAPANFVASNTEVVETFLADTEQMNAMWNSGEQTDGMLPVIAEQARIDLCDAVRPAERRLGAGAEGRVDDDNLLILPKIRWGLGRQAERGQTAPSRPSRRAGA